MRFNVEFTHTIEITYPCIIEAKNIEEARRIAYNNKFNPFDEGGIKQEARRGLRIEITSIPTLKK